MTSVSAFQVQALSEILLKEQASCGALLETVEDERRAIQMLAVAEFQAINTRRIGILETLHALTQARETAVRTLADTVQLPQASESLQLLLDSWQNPQAVGLRRQYDALMTAAKRAREEIKHNVVLIEGIRQFIEGALNAGVPSVTSSDGYDRNGQRTGAAAAPAVLYQQG